MFISTFEVVADYSPLGHKFINSCKPYQLPHIYLRTSNLEQYLLWREFEPEDRLEPQITADQGTASIAKRAAESGLL